MLLQIKIKKFSDYPLRSLEFLFILQPYSVLNSKIELKEYLKAWITSVADLKYKNAFLHMFLAFKKCFGLHNLDYS